MTRRIWTGVIAGVLAAAVLLTVGIGAYAAGRDDTTIARVSDGEVVRVVGDHWRGPGFGFFLFPLLIILLVLLVVRGRGWRGGWYRHPGGYGPYGCGPYGPYPEDPQETLEQWHRRWHEQGTAPHPPAARPQDAAPPGRSEPAPGEG